MLTLTNNWANLDNESLRQLGEIPVELLESLESLLNDQHHRSQEEEEQRQMLSNLTQEDFQQMLKTAQGKIAVITKKKLFLEECLKVSNQTHDASMATLGKHIQELKEAIAKDENACIRRIEILAKQTFPGSQVQVEQQNGQFIVTHTW